MPPLLAEPSLDEIAQLQLWQTFWSNKYLILVFSIIALLISSLYAFVLAKPRYAVSTYINTPLMNFDFLKSQDRGGGNLYKVKVDTYSSDQTLQALKKLFVFSSTKTQNFLQIDNTYEPVAEIDRIEHSLATAQEFARKERQRRTIKLRKVLTVAQVMDHNSRGNIVQPSQNSVNVF